jgi:hypothetical protein
MALYFLAFSPARGRPRAEYPGWSLDAAAASPATYL